jgi:hypothetical protein
LELELSFGRDESLDYFSGDSAQLARSTEQTGAPVG